MNTLRIFEIANAHRDWHDDPIKLSDFSVNILSFFIAVQLSRQTNPRYNRIQAGKNDDDDMTAYTVYWMLAIDFLYRKIEDEHRQCDGLRYLR